MARVTGPLMSFDASGSVAGAIVFSKWRGRNYVRRHAVPSNPRSAAQQAVRSIVGFLSQAWADVVSYAQATWEPGADSLKISPFNRYMGVNARDWRDLLPPSQSTPANRANSPTAPGSAAATVSGRQVSVASTWTTGTDDWGIVLCRSLITGFTPSAMNAVALASALSYAGALVDGPLAPGTYFYRLFSFSNDGKKSSATAEESATVV